MIWKNRPSNGNDIFLLVSWFYLINRVFGVWPFSIEFSRRGANKKIQSVVCVKFWDWIWFILSLAIYVLLIIVILNEMNLTGQGVERPNVPRYLEVLINNVAVTSDIVATLFAIIMDMINRKDIWKIITTFNDFDEEVYVCTVNRKEEGQNLSIGSFRCRNWDTDLIIIITRSGYSWQQQLCQS